MFDSTLTDAALGTIGTPNSAVVEGQAETSCDPHLVSLYHQVAPITAVGAMLVASVALLGWIIDIPILTSFGPGWVRMKVNAAVLFLVLGIALYLISTPRRAPRRVGVFINSAIVLASAIAGASLFEDILGMDLGIDQFLAVEPPEAIETVHLGRIAPLTSTAIITVSLALFVGRAGGTRCGWLLGSLCILGLMIALSVLLGYGFGDHELYTMADHATAMAFPSAIVILLLSIGILCNSPGHLLFRRLASSGNGGFMLRRLMPMAFVSIVVVTALRLWAEDAGLFKTGEFGAVAVAATLIVIVGIIVTLAAAQLDHIDCARAAAEESVRQLNILLRCRLSDLEMANKELEEITYSMSHDLRTPLRAIDGFSRMLSEAYRDRLDGEAERIIRVVRDGVVKMSRLIDDILAFSRVGRVKMTPGCVDMKELVQEVLQEFEPATAGRQVSFIITDLPAATGDRAMLRSVWQILLDNALKYTSMHESALIEIDFAVAADELIYFVKDDGVGFDMQFADNLFGVFRRLHGNEEFPGTGIGLAIVKRVVVRHGGRTWGHGEPGKGATIYFALPTAKDMRDDRFERG